jgi:hypothetical protein
MPAPATWTGWAPGLILVGPSSDVTARSPQFLWCPVPSPDLAAQVDEIVKAAKRAYEDARAKAHAEARKRL